MSMIRVGVVGAGVISTNAHLPVLCAMDGVEIAWIADSNEMLAKNVASSFRSPFASLSGGIADLPAADIVLLAIPIPPRKDYFDHYRMTATGLLVEKPLANDADEHRALGEVFPDWQISVGYQRRFYGWAQSLRQIVQSGTLGDLRSIRLSEGGRLTKTGGAGQYQSLPVSQGGGVVKNLGCHALDLAVWLTEAKEFSIIDCESAWDDETDQRCSARIKLRRSDGAQIPVDFAVSWIDRMDNRMDFHFDGGTLACPVSPSEDIKLLSPGGMPIAKLSVGGVGRATTSSQAFFLEWEAMIEGWRARSCQRLSAQSTLLCARLIDSLTSEWGHSR